MAISKISNTNAIDTGAVNQAALATGVAGTGPVFSAYMSANQTVTSNVDTKIAFNSVHFDTASCYNASTYRYTPNVAGYYQVTFTGNPYGSAQAIRAIFYIYKNGSSYKRVMDLAWQANTYGYNNGGGGTCVVYMNGTTDYLECYAQVAASSGTIQWYGGNSDASQFSVVLVRSA